MTLVSDAMIFAACAHDGMLRKGTNLPYILHPAEVAAIAATLAPGYVTLLREQNISARFSQPAARHSSSMFRMTSCFART